MRSSTVQISFAMNWLSRWICVLIKMRLDTQKLTNFWRPWLMYPLLLKKKEANMSRALSLWVVSYMSFRKATWDFVNLFSDVVDILNLVVWSNIMPLWRVSVLKMPSDDITAGARPDGDEAFFHKKKLPNRRVAVMAEEIEQSMPDDSNRLFNITWAFRLFEHLKNLSSICIMFW